MTDKTRLSEQGKTQEFSPTKHVLVPKHEIMTKEEVEELLNKYRIKPQQLPYILASDPIVKEIGAKPGDVIRIIRQTETAGKSVYYRLVVRE
ncbi:MAG: DNA-directed RNA polymerase subunit H [Nitrososphaerota archaeon]|nr:DNA-directed RNA polymerase subunit H [Aigarchaeota archaeon]MDW8076238.1 DNA-directed RNA polymerase subunit H [Nitrososphaerota archaeon]